MKIEASSKTDVGRVRQANEDACLVDADLGLYVVCDGMGGHAAGDVAAKLAIETLHEFLTKRRAQLDAVAREEAPATDAAVWMQHGIQTASRVVHHLSTQAEGQAGMGCTCTALLLLGGKAILGHVGDSRIYLRRGEDVYLLSEDHTFLREAVRQGTMTPAEAAASELTNVVTRAVGPKPTVMVDTLVFDALPGDTFLLCSDGLHNYVHRQDELAGALGAADLHAVTSQLIETANERGGDDNITAVAVRLSTRPEEEKAGAARAHRVTSELTTLRHVVLFHELAMKELVLVANEFEHIDYAEGDVVVAEGEASDAFFILVSGEAAVSRGGEVLTTLSSGDHFGEMGLLGQRPRTATVRTTMASQLLRLERERFHALLGGHPDLGAKVLWRLAQTLSLRLDELYEHRDGDDPPRWNDDTQGVGLFPSPFGQTKPDCD